MLKDIERPKVEGVAVAVSQDKTETGELVWVVYLINLLHTPLESVLVNSAGYGELKGKQVKTSSLRYFLDTIPARSFRRIEPIMDDVLVLSNQYWVSFYKDKTMYDKKFIFVPGSIDDRNLIELPLTGTKGVMIS